MEDESWMADVLGSLASKSTSDVAAVAGPAWAVGDHQAPVVPPAVPAAPAAPAAPRASRISMPRSESEWQIPQDPPKVNGEAEIESDSMTSPGFSSRRIFVQLLKQQREKKTHGQSGAVTAGYVFEPTAQELELCDAIDKVHAKLTLLLEKPRLRRYGLNRSLQLAKWAKARILRAAGVDVEEEKISNGDEDDESYKGFCVLIDSSEGMVAPFFHGHLPFVFVMNLEIGDYWFIRHDQLLYLIERKDEHDYLSSLHSGHLKEQKARMQGLPLPVYRQCILYEGAGEFPTPGLMPLDRHAKGNTGWRASVGTPNTFAVPVPAARGGGRGGRGGRGSRGGRGGRAGRGHAERFKSHATVRRAEANAIHRDGFQWRRTRCLLDTVLLLYVEILSFLEEGCRFADAPELAPSTDASSSSGSAASAGAAIASRNTGSALADPAVRKAQKMVPADLRDTPQGVLSAMLDMVPGIGPAPGMAVAAIYGSMDKLIKAYRKLDDEKARDALLKGIEYSDKPHHRHSDTGKAKMSKLKAGQAAAIHRFLFGLPLTAKKRKAPSSKDKSKSKKGSGKDEADSSSTPSTKKRRKVQD